jgi:ectoine hydroxylase-related dioxygenase (phytanoyl-CoA dioxygenase family)
MVSRVEEANPLSKRLWRDGHVFIAGAADRDHFDEQRRAIRSSVKRLADERREIENRDTYGKAFLQVTNLWRKDDAVRKFVFDRKLAQIAADLLEVEKVRLYHDQALFKEPGGGHTPWHQDKFYWPLDTHKMITMWMPLVDIDEEMGVVRFASGSHELGGVRNVEISDESEDFYTRYLAERQFQIDGPARMSAGDATFHLGWTIHSAGPNRTDRMREVMTVIYFADGARITDPDSEFQRADLEAWFPGQQPGEVAASPLNPVLN